MSKKIGTRVSITISPETAAWLAAESERSGATVCELVRRAIRLLAFSEAQVKGRFERGAALAPRTVSASSVLSPVLLARVAASPNLEKC